MKILMIVTWYGDKKDKFTGNFHTDMAKALAKKNEVAIYFPFDRGSNKRFSYENEDGILVFRGIATQGRENRFKATKSDFKKIREVFNPDIIHAHVCLGAGEIAMYIKLLYGIPYILTEHSPIEMIGFGAKTKLKYKLITYFSKANVAVSPDLSDKLNKLYKNSKFVYINNGVNDPKRFLDNNIIDIEDAKCINCALVGGLYSKEIKGVQYLLPAIKALNDEKINIRLHLCGGGKYLDYFKNMAEQIGVIKYVNFYGMCDKKKVYEIVNRVDFTISASLYESAGVVVEESCLLGKPQVITNSGGANSLIPDKYAIKVGKSSVDELYNGIKKMLFKLGEFSSDEIREYGLANFTMEVSCSQYEQLYKSVLNRRKERK